MNYSSAQTTTRNYDLPVRRSLHHASQQQHFEIQQAADVQHQLVSQKDPPQRLRHFEIWWFKKASGTLLIDTTIHPVTDQTIFWLSPGQLRSCQLNSFTEGCCISFSSDFLYLSTPHSGNTGWHTSYSYSHTPVITTDTEMELEMEIISRKMQKEFANYYLLRSQILAGLLNLLVIYFSRKMTTHAAEPTPSKDVELVHKFVALIKQHFAKHKLVADYADILCVTANYLNRAVKKITGSPASYHIQQHIILEAKRQVIHSNVSMKEIAYLLGFDDHAHFSKYFKNYSGKSFTNYKRSLQDGIGLQPV
ncbi:MAG: helix-turn-helix domain-containing protein [Chitinophagaceae bacterium]